MLSHIDEASDSENESRSRGKAKMSARAADNVNGKGNKPAQEDEGPACQSCRKKKAKCSRRQPCSHCVRFGIDCVYDDKKMKPGLRTGAVENLSQRVVALENMFLGQGILWQQVFRCLDSISTRTPTSPDSPNGNAASTGESLKDCAAQLKATLTSISANGLYSAGDPIVPIQQNPLKRKRDEIEPSEDGPAALQPDIENASESLLPPDDLIDSLVDIYFRKIHPWIPILHANQFRARMAKPQQRQKLNTIFHAITSLCVRFSEDPRLSNAAVRARYAKKCRETVILQSMESFSVENLQALVICAFDIIGSGRGPSAWSIVGSMTRTVEQLQLSVEDEDKRPPSEFLIKRMAFLPAAESWTEQEERRRAFWNVFLMDRFCSIATGWNFSLTSADVKRRLPCEGALWEKGKPLKTPTPYFGIADKSANGALPTSRPELEDQASIGGFAYCIEASESLSLVTTFFLRHAVNVSSPNDVQMWLMRFKELDLRLVQWKIFLPEQWREACALNADGILDPNLTLAHITHNTAVGLLHQGIAYPSAEWQASHIRLPSVSSAETCMAAATEVAIIAEKYLLDSTSPTNAQFAFCLFISGRMFLAHVLHYGTSLPPEFDSLINSLMEISRRWNGPHVEPGSKNADNLASKFATRLIQARNQGPHSLDIRQSAYSEEQVQDSANTQDGMNIEGNSNQIHHLNNILSGSEMPSVDMTNGHSIENDTIIVEPEGSPDSISLAFPPLPSAFQPHYTSATQTAMPSPLPGNAHIQPNQFYGQHSEEGPQTGSEYPDPRTVEYNGTMTGFEDLHSFFEYSFLPNQRISMFSGPPGKEDEHQQ
ncbi:fungal-specific transcription factor domain-containing protein [Xylogone sp. PMI_703]|nr:fungal-specific transcription factor domain-containing protein [Xylogone sp. PMI_703]